jgi:hypothetical protein
MTGREKYKTFLEMHQGPVLERKAKAYIAELPGWYRGGLAKRAKVDDVPLTSMSLSSLRRLQAAAEELRDLSQRAINIIAAAKGFAK